jgi:hypothetical protein
MNQEKAKEFFSSYYEGTLDPGLKQALEHAMGKDSSLREDYREFENNYEDLGSLKFETIEIPFELNDKILANIDRHLIENRKSQPPAWMMWLRNVAIAGVSCVAILGAVLSLRNLNGERQEAGGFNTGSSKEQLAIEPNTNHDVTIRFTPSKTETLVIREGLDGNERRRTTVLEGKELTTTLENQTANAMAFELEIGNNPRSTLIALPGTVASTVKTGQGNLEEFAKALASYYRVAVEVRVTSPALAVTWDFQAPDALNAAMGTLNLTEYVLTRQHNNLLVISEK